MQQKEWLKLTMDFSHAVIDDNGDIIRKYRWSVKEAKWHKDQGKNVIKLDVKVVKINQYQQAWESVGESLY
jgi:hypothetical protein